MSVLDFMLTKTANEGPMPAPPPEEMPPQEGATVEDVADQVDLEQLSDEELERLKQTAEALQEGDESELSPEEERAMNAPAEEEENLTEEDAEKIANAAYAWNDLAGRVQAHAFHSEMRKIAEEEAEDEEGKKNKGGKSDFVAKKKKEEAEEQEKTASANLAYSMKQMLMSYYG